MKKIQLKKILFVMASVLFLAVAVSCNGKKSASNAASDVPSSPRKYSVAGGSVGGNYYLMGGGLAQVLNNRLGEYYLWTAETTGGGTANLVMLQNGEAELGIALSSSLYEASVGAGEWTGGKKLDKLRGAVPLYPSWFTLYTLRDSGIKSFSDLQGKRVGLGSKGAGTNSIFTKFLADRGITPAQIHNDGHAASATALSNGVINAVLLFSYPPFAAIAELESTKDLSFVPLNEDEQNALVAEYPFYSKDAMPAGSYKGATAAVPGVSEWNMAVTSSDVPEAEVYRIVKALYEYQDDMIAVHSSAKYMTPENSLNFNIPLHAGVVRYLKEKGITVPPELIPPEYTGK